MSTSKSSIALFFATMMLALLIATCQDYYAKTMKNFPCYKRRFILKRFDCINQFYLSFRKAPFQSCPDKVVEMDECRELVDEECLAQVDPKSFKYRLYKRVHPKQTKKELVQEFCRDAGLNVRYMSEASLKNIGCTVDFYHEKVKCIKEFQQKWRHNRGSKLLCREYYAKDECLKRAAAEHCPDLERIKKKIDNKFDLSLAELPYNPFCVRKQT